MSWQQHALTEPASFRWIKTAKLEEVQFTWFIQACKDWIAWQQECGSTAEFFDPDTFAQSGDLQTLANVVSWWPKGGTPTALRCPSLMDAVVATQVPANALIQWTTLKEFLDARVEACKAWLRTQGGNTENPNETSAERAKRKNAERQARWRLRHAERSEDPEHNALIETARREAESLQQARTWLRQYVKDQKVACDGAIRAAKQARDDNVSAAQHAVAEQEKRMLDAKAIADSYRINK